MPTKNIKYRHSFKVKLIFTTMLIAVIISTVFSIISVNSFTYNETKANQTLISSYGNHSAEEILRTVKTNQDIFETISQKKEIYSFVTEIYKNSTIQEAFAELSEEDKLSGEFYINYTSKYPVYHELLNYFNDIIETVEDTALIRIFSPDGNIIVGSAYGEENTKDYKGDKGWFHDVIDANSTFDINETLISPISLARRQNNEPAIRYVKAISLNSSERQGLFVMNINAIKITNSIENIKIGNTGFGMLVDLNYENAEGIILGEVYLAHGYDNSLIFNESSAGNIVITRDMFLENNGLSELGFIQYETNNTSWEAAYKRVEIYDREVYVIISLSSEEFYQNVVTYKYTLFTGLFILLLILSVIIYVITSSSLKSLNSLIEATTVISKGNLDHKIINKSRDEFGILSRNFIIMIESIKSNLDLIKDSELRYKMLFMVFPNATIVYQNDELKLANPEFYNLFGEDINIDSSIFQLYDNTMMNLRELINYIEVNSIYKIDEFYGFAHDEQFPLNIQVNRIRYMGEEAYILFFEDITDKIRLEDEKLQKMKLETLSLLAGGIAHDFNNMLMLIQGNVNILQTEIDLPHYIELLDEIEITVKHATQLSKQFLTFTKGGEPVIKPEYIQNSIEDTVSLAIRGSSSIYKISIDENLPAINIDLSQITQVISNIIINAVQAMPKGGIVNINVSTTKEDHKEFVIISISDTGPGIPKKYRDKIFSPYFSTKAKGSGLGLATSYSIISKHGGHITFETDKSGTTFIIYLPISDKIPEIVEKKNKIGIRLKGRILLLEDNIAIQKTIANMMERIGLNVTVTSKGEDCIDAYCKSIEDNNKFDVVILDLIIIEGMGGRETMEKLLIIDPEIKTIVTSGFSNDNLLSNYLEYGFIGILPKPFSHKDLINELEKILNSEQ